MCSVRKLQLCDELDRSSCGNVLFNGYLPPPGNLRTGRAERLSPNRFPGIRLNLWRNDARRGKKLSLLSPTTKCNVIIHRQLFILKRNSHSGTLIPPPPLAHRTLTARYRYARKSATQCVSVTTHCRFDCIGFGGRGPPGGGRACRLPLCVGSAPGQAPQPSQRGRLPVRGGSGGARREGPGATQQHHAAQPGQLGHADQGGGEGARRWGGGPPRFGRSKNKCRVARLLLWMSRAGPSSDPGLVRIICGHHNWIAVAYSHFVACYRCANLTASGFRHWMHFFFFSLPCLNCQLLSDTCGRFRAFGRTVTHVDHFRFGDTARVCERRFQYYDPAQVAAWN